MCDILYICWFYYISLNILNKSCPSACIDSACYFSSFFLSLLLMLLWRIKYESIYSGYDIAIVLYYYALFFQMVEPA